MARPRRGVLGRALLLIAALLVAACNPLDPDKIDRGTDSGTAATGCTPACAAQQYCLSTTTGACGCFDACDDALCEAGSCVIDPTQGAVCVDLAQATCR